ncbi:iron-containing alcohol dehydrogenase [Rickettsiales bacterium]|nr:iron-containing alcohol dehydrogenase [Rickettsiales bacterium]
MSVSVLNDILQGRWIDPDNGRPLDFPVKDIFMQAGLKNNIAEYIADNYANDKHAIICDDNTYEILGQFLEEKLSSKLIKLPKNVKAEEKYVTLVTNESKDCDLLIAVGSGTINDICKYSSYLGGKDYIACPTAPSMNGYLSANAAITVNGHKKSLKAHLPKAVLADLDILANAPIRLIQSGLGDSVCRPTAQADWLLSHLLLDTDYKDAPFAMLKPIEPLLWENSSNLLKADIGSVGLLMETLLLSGIGMYICGGSYPASQGEHLIAHSLDMGKDVAWNKLYHGEQIAITTMTMANIQHKIIYNGISVKESSYDEGLVGSIFGRKVEAQCKEEYSNKHIDKDLADSINIKIKSDKGNLEKKLLEVMVSPEKILKTLKYAQINSGVEEIGVDSAKYQQYTALSKYIRGRFTFLDVDF